MTMCVRLPDGSLTATVTATRVDEPRSRLNGAEQLASATAIPTGTALHLESKCMPSPGGQINRMGACHPDDLPEGYHTAARGQSLARSAAVASRAAHGRPRGRAAPGRRDGTGRRGQRQRDAGVVTRSVTRTPRERAATERSG